MALRITSKQRDALYDQFLDRLSGIDDVRLAVQAGELDTAQRLGQAFSDDLRLVVEDLGWGQGAGTSIELNSPPDVLRRVFTRLGEVAAGERESEEPEWVEARQMQERNRLVAEACQTVLARLGPPEGGAG